LKFRQDFFVFNPVNPVNPVEVFSTAHFVHPFGKSGLSFKILVFSESIAIVPDLNPGDGDVLGTMKIVVMSDTHLSKTTEEFKALCSEFCDDADMVIHLGDWDKVEILNYLEQYPLEAVAGNMDDYLIRQRLPASRILKAGPFRLGITHGWGSRGGIRQRLEQEFAGTDAVLFGHTHQPFIFRENGLLWFNPGSVFLGRGSCRKTLGVLTIQDKIEAEILQI